MYKSQLCSRSVGMLLESFKDSGKFREMAKCRHQKGPAGRREAVCGYWALPVACIVLGAPFSFELPVFSSYPTGRIASGGYRTWRMDCLFVDVRRAASLTRL